MIEDQNINPEMLKDMEKASKLLALSRRNTSESEMASAAMKAQALMEKWNLTVAQVERAGEVAADGRREEQKQAGGMYLYQRRLWRAVAELNFCVYWTTDEWVAYPQPRMKKGRMIDGRYKNRHKLVGRQANVRVTIDLVRYLEDTIERLCRERLHGRTEGSAQAQFFSRWAVSWREGVAERVIERLQERRRKQLSEEEKAVRDRLRAGMKDASTATALTLTDVAQKEKDLNQDFINGDAPGTRARVRAEDAVARAAAEAEHAAWAAAHPEEAAAEAEKEREERKKYRSRGRAYRGTDRDWSALRDGYESGSKVGLDRQAESAESRGRIGRG